MKKEFYVYGLLIWLTALAIELFVSEVHALFSTVLSYSIHINYKELTVNWIDYLGWLIILVINIIFIRIYYREIRVVDALILTLMELLLALSIFVIVFVHTLGWSLMIFFTYMVAKNYNREIHVVKIVTLGVAWSAFIFLCLHFFNLHVRFVGNNLTALLDTFQNINPQKYYRIKSLTALRHIVYYSLPTIMIFISLLTIPISYFSVFWLFRNRGMAQYNDKINWVFIRTAILLWFGIFLIEFFISYLLHIKSTNPLILSDPYYREVQLEYLGYILTLIFIFVFIKKYLSDINSNDLLVVFYFYFLFTIFCPFVLEHYRASITGNYPPPFEYCRYLFRWNLDCTYDLLTNGSLYFSFSLVMILFPPISYFGLKWFSKHKKEVVAHV